MAQAFDAFNTNAAQVIAQLLQNPGNVNQMQLLALRKQYGNDPTMQQVLAPYEHQAYTRETVQRNPWSAIPLAVATPAYAAAKGLGILGSRSGSSDPLAQIIAGYKGIWQGLTQGGSQ
jgi:hypothetical protein